MKRKRRTPLIVITVAILVAGLVTLIDMDNNQEGPYFEGNVRKFDLAQLALVQNTGAMDCDAFNQISVTYDDGQYQTLASGQEGFAPFIDDSHLPLDLVKSGKGIQQVHFELALSCDGDAMDGTTVVSGQVKVRICGDPDYDTTTCIRGSEGFGTQFVPITFGNTALQPDVKKVIMSDTWSESGLLNHFDTGNGKIFFKHESYPIVTFNFVHPTEGSFTATYNAESYNDKVIAQYGLIENTNFSAPVDSDGDGIDDGNDSCPSQPETFNGFEDGDGCPDDVPGEEDTDDDGIPDNVDQCDTQPETFNGFEDADGCPDISPDDKALRIDQWSPQLIDLAFNESVIEMVVGIQNFELNEIAPFLEVRSLSGSVKETFQLPAECISASLGWNTCSVAIELDTDKYALDSYKIALTSPSRTDATVPIEILNTTPFCIANPNDSQCTTPDPDPDPDPVEDITEVITEFFGDETQTTDSGVKITRSSTGFSNGLGTDDMMIIFVLIAIVVAVALLAKFSKKK